MWYFWAGQSSFERAVGTQYGTMVAPFRKGFFLDSRKHNKTPTPICSTEMDNVTKLVPEKAMNLTEK